jgi:hypothetical protein
MSRAGAAGHGGGGELVHPGFSVLQDGQLHRRRPGVADQDAGAGGRLVACDHAQVGGDGRRSRDQRDVREAGSVRCSVDGPVKVGNPYGHRLVLLGGGECGRDQVADQHAVYHALPVGFG